jgi:ATP-dependent RNA helicase DDX51/DBP6
MIIDRAEGIVMNTLLRLPLQVFDQLVPGTGLKVEIVLGQQTFKEEKQRLVDANGESLVDVLICTPGRLMDHLVSSASSGFTLQHLRFLVLILAYSVMLFRVIHHSPLLSFDLTFIAQVIDEADRLLMEAYQKWLPAVLDAAHNGRVGTASESGGYNKQFRSVRFFF